MGRVAAKNEVRRQAELTLGEDALMVHRAIPLFAGALLLGTLGAGSAFADGPNHGGILKMYHRDSPGSPSIHEEATYSTNIPFMGVFNNLVLYKQDVAQ